MGWGFVAFPIGVMAQCRRGESGTLPEETEPPVREFADRGTLWLLDLPENLRGLLKLVAAPLVDKLDFSRAERQNRSFIPDDLQKQEADLLYKIPFLRGRAYVWVYVLLEHQSKPDRTMAFRLLSYMVQVWEGQVHAARSAKTPVKLYPVLPIVFYTGRKRWAQLPSLRTLMELPKELEAFVPAWETLFLNLHETPPDTLTNLGDAAALALRALQASDAPKERLAEALREVALRLDALPDAVHAQITKALTYLYLLIKHKRAEDEQDELFAILNEAIERRAEELKEVEMTGAEALIRKGREEGREQGQRELLVKQLTIKFGPLPESIVSKVTALSERRLETLAERFVTAASLAELEL
jgi:predicted transposase/invertase (TIGR01784 family)